jgi:hypothetical protein
VITKLINIQKTVGAIKKDAANPFFRSRYATLEAILSELTPVLNEQKLFLSQHVDCFEGQWYVETVVYDAGDKVSESMKLGRVPVINTKGDAQGLGSAISFARRYGVAAAFGLWQTDDDAETAVGRPIPQQQAAPAQAKPRAAAPAPRPAPIPVVDAPVNVVIHTPAPVKAAAPVVADTIPFPIAPPTAAPAAPAFDYSSTEHRKLLIQAIREAGILPTQMAPVRAAFEAGWWKGKCTSDVKDIARALKICVSEVCK